MSESVEVWPRCPEAATFFETLFRNFAAANPLIEAMAARFLSDGVRLPTLVDHWILPTSECDPDALNAMGLTLQTLPEGDAVWVHPGARLPRLRFKAKRTTPCLALAVEDVDAFAQANSLTFDACHGDFDSSYRCAHLALPHGELMPIVRQGYNGFAPGTLSTEDTDSLTQVRQMFRNRRRTGTETEVLSEARQLAEKAVSLLGQGRATDEFFAAEREYYLPRNRAAQFQYAQQQRLGIGWANHDHHTYRSSRSGFRGLIQLWNTFGFLCRERFYAGAEAGWGAQVLEHPVSRVVIFADVDMSPEELSVDYANEDLPPRDTLGTIGLWCALHTSSIAEAGMHHIECEFDFERAQASVEAAGHGVMAPFTNLPMLKQAFTVAEMWQVPQERLSPLVTAGYITAEQAEKFRTQGAPGSHLEILQRWEGFKGFNKTGVSNIIRDTDARN